MASAQQVVLSAQSVSKVYRMGEVDVPALRDASLDILDGEFLIIVGPSGSGKSTLLNMIGGMDRPTSGTVRFLDQDLTSASDRELPWRVLGASTSASSQIAPGGQAGMGTSPSSTGRRGC